MENPDSENRSLIERAEEITRAPAAYSAAELAAADGILATIDAAGPDVPLPPSATPDADAIPEMKATDEMPVPDRLTEAKPATPRAMGFSVDEMNKEYTLILTGAKAVVVKEGVNGRGDDRLQLLSPDAFFTWHANRWTERPGPDGKIKAVTWGRAWMEHPQRKQAEGIEFFPNPDGAAGTPNHLNLWRGFSVEPSPNGKCDIFLDHMRTIVCGGDLVLYGWVLGWFAHMIQHPRERIGTALVLRGPMGAGKSIVGEVFGSLIRAHYVQVDDARYIGGHFNSHMANCLLLQCEEAVFAGDMAMAGRLKGLITSKTQMIEPKGIDPIRVDNFVRLLMTSNEDWVVPAGKGERRFCVIDVQPGVSQNHEYFREMLAELENGGYERLLYELQRFDLATVNLRKIPQTNALLEQKLRTLDMELQWWFERLCDGTQTSSGKHWGVSVALDRLYADYVKSADMVGVRRKRDKSSFGGTLLKVTGAKRRRLRDRDAEETRRVACYEFPDLATCRARFEAEIGQPIEWPEADEGEPVSDEVPV